MSVGRSTREDDGSSGLAVRMVLTLVASTLLNVLLGVLTALLVLVTVTLAVIAFGMLSVLVAVIVALPFDVVWGWVGWLLDPVVGPVLDAVGSVVDLVAAAFAQLRTAVAVVLVVLFGLAGLQGALAFLVDAAGQPLAQVLLACGAVFCLAFAVPAVIGPRLLVRDVEAHDVDADGEPRLVETLQRVAMRADVTTPRVAVVESPVPRSFAAGRKGNGTVVVTRGLLEVLDDDELEAALAHEVSHLANRDATVICYSAFYPLIYARWMQWWKDSEESQESDDVVDRAHDSALEIGTKPDERVPDGEYAERFGVVAPALKLLFFVLSILSAVAGLLWMIWVTIFFVTAILATGFVDLIAKPVLSTGRDAGGTLSAYLSRRREYAADRGAAAITGDPASLASALATLHDTEVPPETDLRATEAVEPLSILPIGEGTDNPTGVAGRFESRTHPPVEERIDRLREMARRQET